MHVVRIITSLGSIPHLVIRDSSVMCVCGWVGLESLPVWVVHCIPHLVIRDSSFVFWEGLEILSVRAVCLA